MPVPVSQRKEVNDKLAAFAVSRNGCLSSRFRPIPDSHGRPLWGSPIAKIDWKWKLPPFGSEKPLGECV